MTKVVKKVVCPQTYQYLPLNGDRDMEREYGMHFAKFLKERRRILNLTQEELALKLNVSKSAVNKWESGKGIPDRFNMRQLSMELGVSINEIYRICEGDDDAIDDSRLISDLINVLEIHGYKVTREEE